MTNPDMTLPDACSAQLSERLGEMRHARGDMPPVPDEATLRQILTVGFWASLTRNEDRPCQFTLVVDAGLAVVEFESSAPFNVDEIRRLAPAAGFPYGGIALSVLSGGPTVRGLSRILPPQRGMDGGLTALRFQWRAPGELIVSFDNRAILEYASGSIRWLEHWSFDEFVRDCVPDHASRAVLWNVVEAARRLGHGGTILVVRGDDCKALSGGYPCVAQPEARWRAAGRRLSDRSSASDPGMEEGRRFMEQWDIASVWSGIDGIAQLTAVDGALVLSRTMQELRFGATIEVGTKSKSKSRILATVAGSREKQKSGKMPGGKRHQSAIEFVASNKEAVGVVISQDGPVKLLRWNEEHKLVEVIDAEPFFLGAPVRSGWPPA
ncbi:MAG: hypothetical protein IT379_31125 [Deltaproteobacteria bacterium]|nr:hypothetical protein [Deltaproteobacteria bacterium]